TTMRTGRDGYSCAWDSPQIIPRERNKALAQRTQRPPAAFHRLRRNQHKSDDARLLPAVHPVVDRSPLYQDVPGAQMDLGALELHVDLAGEHHGVVDRLGAMVARRNAGLELDDPEDSAARMRRAHLARAAV